MGTEQPPREIWFAIRNGMLGIVHWKGWALFVGFAMAAVAILYAARLFWFPIAISGILVLVGIFLVLLRTHLDRP